MPNPSASPAVSSTVGPKNMVITTPAVRASAEQSEEAEVIENAGILQKNRNLFK